MKPAAAAALNPASRSRSSWNSQSRARLRQQLADDLSAHLAELLFAAGVQEAQLVVVQAQQMQQRDMEVLDRMHGFHGSTAHFVGRADNLTRLDAAASNTLIALAL